ncbi:MAG: PAS domain S-box protein [Anaerolineales bacterium]|nr:PAS domain S-box protein [Anaerolineales bacterium]
MVPDSSGQKAASSAIGYIHGDMQLITRMFNWIIVLIATAVLLAIINTKSHPQPINTLWLCLPFLLIPYYWVRKQAFETAAIFIAVFFMTVTTMFSTYGLGIHDIATLAYPAIIIVASLVTQKRTMVFIVLYNIACIAWLVFGDMSGAYTPEVLEKSTSGDFFSVSLVVILTASIVRLVTESLFQSHQQLQRELRERKLAEEKYRNIFENSIDGIFQSTPQGRLISVNPSMAAMYGYASPEDMVNNITDIASQIYINPESRDVVRKRLEDGEQIKGYESLEYRKDGSTLWVSMNAQAIRDHHGRILFYEGTVEDITLRKEMEIKRNEAEVLYRSLVEQTSIVVYRLSPDTSASCLYISPQIEVMLGYSPEEWLQEPAFWKKIVHPHDLPGVLADVEHYMEKKGKSAIEYRIQDKSGNWHWVLDETVVVKGETGNVQFVQGVFLDITERKQAENSLIQFKELMNESNDSIFIIDQKTGQYIDFNRQACEKLGYGREELLEFFVFDIAQHIHNIEEWHDRVNLVREKGGSIFETNHKRKDGSIFPVEVSARLLESTDQPVVLAFVRDISDRKNTEKIVQENQNRLQAFFNQSLDGFFFTIFDTPRAWNDRVNKEEVLHQIFTTERYTEVNDAMLEQYGMTREKFLSLTSSDVFAHDPQQGLKLRRQLFDNGHLHIETFEKTKNGSPVWFEGDYVCLYDEQKRISGFFGIQRDITKRKQSELEMAEILSELANKNEESETLRESLASVIDTVEFTEIVQRILDQIKRVIPYDSASVWKVEDNLQKFVAGRGLPEGVRLIHPIDGTNSATPLLQGDVAYVISNNVQDELPDFKEHPDDLINSWLAIPLKTRGNIIGFIALDGYQQEQFNDRHVSLALSFANQVAIALENSRLFSDLQSELALRKNLISELETKNTELERFTYTVSHDLKSPLVTINGFLGYLEADINAGNLERVKQDRERIQGAVNKMHLLLNDLLELSRIGRLMNKPEVVRFEDLVTEALQIVHGRLEEYGVTVHTQPGLPAIYGDRQRLVEVLQNLLDNAAKFMGKQKDPHIEIGQCGEENGKPIFYVRDNGIGIAPEYHEQVFGLFNKLDATRSDGTGIGLAIVKRIIEVHDGRIWVESEAGKGATFCFTLQTSVETK